MNIVSSIDIMEEGARLHKEYQQNQIEKFINSDTLYSKEVKVKEEIEYKNINFTINGRIDSLIEEKDTVIVEEIKSVHKLEEDLPIDKNKAYYSQLLLYGYFYTKNIEDKKIICRLTYISRSDESVKSVEKEFSKNELLTFFMDTIEAYYKFVKVNIDNTEEMIVTGRTVPFPYDSYRESQKAFMSAVYNSISNKNKLFAYAPTGVGKTLSTLFPSIKALSNNLGKKIFYITAKSITKNVCIENLQMLNNIGFKGILLNICSKEDMCINGDIKCNALDCPYAIGYFDKVNDAILDIIKNEKIITEPVIKAYAKKHSICPYYYSLELIEYVHIVVCDYNYVYNPSVSFSRYFEKEKNDFIILVDEAHNLEDRSRDFFSATVKKSDIELILDNVEHIHIKNICRSIIKNYKNLFENHESYFETSYPKSLLNSFADLRFLLDEVLADSSLNEDTIEQILSSYFKLDYFIKTSMYYDKKYKTLFEIEFNKDLSITLFCIDTSTRFSNVNMLCRNVVFFSATLAPIDYFSDLYGGTSEDYFISLETSFDIKNQLTLVNDKISTYYKDRDSSYKMIAENIDSFVRTKEGNYFVFFPSYKYLNSVVEEFEKLNDCSDILVQKGDMSKNERELFLQNFDIISDTTKIGFLVSGGTFSEGVNLVGDKLVGAVVVGVGVSMLNFKSDVVKMYYDEKNNMGYEFAYMYQGFNKILQSAGRVIRSETDRGAILFIDTRYKRNDYKALFPSNYSNMINVYDCEEMTKIMRSFWNDRHC